MKRIITIICILSYVSFYGCQNNKNQTPISELINLEEWDSTTIAAMKDKLQLDTLRYIGDDIPPFAINDTIINNFDEHIQHLLRFREKEIAALLEQQIISNEKVIYIHEIQAMSCHAGFIKSFVVMPINKKFRYFFRYNHGTDTFLIENADDFNDYYIEPVLYSEIECGRLTGIEIITKITKNNKSQLSYEIIGLVVN